MQGPSTEALSSTQNQAALNMQNSNKHSYQNQFEGGKKRLSQKPQQKRVKGNIDQDSSEEELKNEDQMMQIQQNSSFQQQFNDYKSLACAKYNQEQDLRYDKYKNSNKSQGSKTFQQQESKKQKKGANDKEKLEQEKIYQVLDLDNNLKAYIDDQLMKLILQFQAPSLLKASSKQLSSKSQGMSQTSSAQSDGIPTIIQTNYNLSPLSDSENYGELSRKEIRKLNKKQKKWAKFDQNSHVKMSADQHEVIEVDKEFEESSLDQSFDISYKQQKKISKILEQKQLQMESQVQQKNNLKQPNQKNQFQSQNYNMQSSQQEQYISYQGYPQQNYMQNANYKMSQGQMMPSSQGFNSILNSETRQAHVQTFSLDSEKDLNEKEILSAQLDSLIQGHQQNSNEKKSQGSISTQATPCVGRSDNQQYFQKNINYFKNGPEDFEILMSQFGSSLEEDLIFDVYIESCGDLNKAWDHLCELEEKAVQVNDQDLLEVINDSDDSDEEMEDQYRPNQNQIQKSDSQFGSQGAYSQGAYLIGTSDSYSKLQNKFKQGENLYPSLEFDMQQLEKAELDAALQIRMEQLERDSLFAQKLQEEEQKRIEELEARASQDIEQEIMRSMNMSEEEFTDMKVLEMLRAFLFDYQFTKVADNNKYKKKKNRQNMDIKNLKLANHEQNVFMNFINNLQNTQFDLLTKINQLKLRLSEVQANKDEEEKKGTYNLFNQNGQTKIQQSQNSVKIHSKEEFPELVSQSVIDRNNKQRQISARMDMHHHQIVKGGHQNRFQANNPEQESMLYQIQDEFPFLDYLTIQESYYAINDALLLREMLRVAFISTKVKGGSGVSGNWNGDLILEKLFKMEQKKQEAERKINENIQMHKQRSNVNRQGTFWTEDILKRFRFMGMKSRNINIEENIYQTSREQSHNLYSMRQRFLQEIKKARISGNHQQLQFAEQQAEKYRQDYERSLQSAQLSIFSSNNQVDSMNYYIDLHGLHLLEAIRILQTRLRQIQVDLDNGSFDPNIDPHNHILKIVCGKGKHSHGKPVLKNQVPKFLEQSGYQFYTFEKDGVILVRFSV